MVPSGGRTDTADLTVTLSNVNEAPTADAGDDQENVVQGATVTLSGTATDPDAGEVLTYAWTQTAGDTVALSDAAVRSPTFTASSGLTADTTLTFTYTVTDDEGLSAGDSVSVTVKAPAAAEPEVEVVALTANVSAVPSSHGGSGSFTFELRFSEEPHDDFSYKTMGGRVGRQLTRKVVQG